MLVLILTAPLLLVLVLFAVSNTAVVGLHLWPFDIAWEMPLAAAVLGAALLAFLLGAVMAWGNGLRHRAHARQVTNAARLLEAELAELRAKQATVVPSTAVAPGTALAPASHA